MVPAIRHQRSSIFYHLDDIHVPYIYCLITMPPKKEPMSVEEKKAYNRNHKRTSRANLKAQREAESSGANAPNPPPPSIAPAPPLPSVKPNAVKPNEQLPEDPPLLGMSSSDTNLASAASRLRPQSPPSSAIATLSLQSPSRSKPPPQPETESASEGEYPIESVAVLPSTTYPSQPRGFVYPEQ